jgi:GNAT superfamily N-acetyltransferase
LKPAFHVRPATLADLPALMEYQLPPGGNPELLERRLRMDFMQRIPAGETFVVVAQVREGIVGYARASRVLRPARGPGYVPSGWYLLGVRVARDWRRFGIGTALIRRRIEWLKTRTDTAWFTTMAKNRASIAAHRAFGFEQQARGVDAPGRRQDPDRLLFKAVLATRRRPPPPPDELY